SPPRPLARPAVRPTIPCSNVRARPAHSCRLRTPRIPRLAIRCSDALERRCKFGIRFGRFAPAAQYFSHRRMLTGSSGDQARHRHAVTFDHKRLATIADATQHVAEPSGERGRGDDLLHKYVLYVIT